MYMAARKLHAVGFECPKMAANSLFNVHGFQEVVRAVEFADRPASWKAYDRTISKLNRTNNFLEPKDRRILRAVERYDPETVELVEYLDSLRN